MVMIQIDDGDGRIDEGDDSIGSDDDDNDDKNDNDDDDGNDNDVNLFIYPPISYICMTIWYRFCFESKSASICNCRLQL